MIYETTTTASANPAIQGSTLLSNALQWATTEGLNHSLGRVDHWGDDMYALVQQRKPLPRVERDDPEAHRRCVDLQYCVEGGEVIDWYQREGLAARSAYDVDQDVQLFDRPSDVPPVPLAMRPGHFAVFFPGDAHVPAVCDECHDECRMIVFKIKLSALHAEQGLSLGAACPTPAMGGI